MRLGIEKLSDKKLTVAGIGEPLPDRFETALVLLRIAGTPKMLADSGGVRVSLEYVGIHFRFRSFMIEARAATVASSE